MASIYARYRDSSGTWKYERVGRGKPHEGSTFHIRFTDAEGRRKWSSPYATVQDAKDDVEDVALTVKAQSAGLTVAEYEDRTNVNRTPVAKAIEKFLAEASKTKKKKTVTGYKQNLAQFQESLAPKSRFMDEITKESLCNFRDFLAGKGYEARTQHNRLMTVLSLLKKNKIKTDFSLTADLPEYEEEPAVPYEPADLKTLFAAMDDEEVVRYKFFLGTACRDKEVTYAAWQDIDFARGIYHIRRKPDVGFTPKKHESRDVKMPTELVELLKERKKHAPNPRWIFVNEEGRPDNHFLRKFKRIALRAGMNCGHCIAPWTAGRYHTTRKILVPCKTHPVCEHHYLHRLRKTCASNWEAKGVPVRTIQYMLGHKSLETTQKYLGITNLDSLTDKIDAAATVVE